MAWRYCPLGGLTGLPRASSCTIRAPPDDRQVWQGCPVLRLPVDPHKCPIAAHYTLNYPATLTEHIGQYFDQETNTATVYRWVRDLSKRADEVLRPMKVDTGGVWVADEVAVKVGGKRYWLFNVMDSDTRFLLSAYLSPTRTTRAAATALAMARQRSNNPPRQLKTDGLASYRDAVPRAFPTHPVKHIVSQGIRAQINNNLSERLQGTIRDGIKPCAG